LAVIKTCIFASPPIENHLLPLAPQSASDLELLLVVVVMVMLVLVLVLLVVVVVVLLLLLLLLLLVLLLVADVSRQLDWPPERTSNC
jgi:hypothetical protein